MTTLTRLSRSGYAQLLGRLLIVALVLGSLQLVALLPVEAAGDVGYRAFSFGPNTSSPTAEKPQSKLWFNDGIWWGSLFNRATEKFQIYRFDWSTQTWSDTGTVIDERNNAKADCLWDGTYLYVATAGPSSTSSSDNARLLRYSYNAATKTYTLDTGFPVSVVSGGMEAIVLAKDTTGMLWMTYTRSSKVYVTHGTTDDRTWRTPYVLPVTGAGNLTSDDISAIVAFNSQIGIMWSNQNDSTMYFATHADGAPDNEWSLNPALQGPEYADDHINLKSLQADTSGRVFAAVKTSLNASDAPLVLLLVLKPTGSWQRYTFGRVADNHTRPLVLIDEENRNLYMFAASPCCSGGVIYYKQTGLDNISFPDGMGTPFIQTSTETKINNPTSTKQNLNSATGLLVLASDNGTDYYLQNTITLGTGGATAPETTIDSGPSGTVNSSTVEFSFSSSEAASTFECRLDGGAWNSCASPHSYSGLTDGSHTFEVRATDADGNTDPSPASRTWTVDTTAPTVTNVAPADGATNVAVSTNAEAVFSEAMDPATLTTTTITLIKQGTTTPIAATVTYDAPSKKVTLNPTADLDPGATYTATIQGGISGAKDLAGNPLATDQPWSFTTTAPDTTPPSVTLTAPANGATVSGLVTLSADASDNVAVARVEFLVNGTVVGTATSTPYSVSWDTTTIADGAGSITARAVDSAGNSTTSASHSVTVDNPPDTTITAGPSGTITSSSASFSFAATDATATFECALDSAPFSPCTSPHSYTGLADGSHTFQVRAVDAAGNSDPSPASQTWTVDTTAPTVSGVAPADGATNVAVSTNVEAGFSEVMDPATLTSSTFTLVRVNADDTTTSVTATVSYDATTWKVTLDPDADLDASATYRATVKGGASGATDQAGNPLVSDTIWSFTTAAPTAPSNLSASRSGGLKNQRIDLSWTDNSGNEAKFVIERATSADFTSNLVTIEVSANTVSYRDTAIQSGTTYYYRVFAVSATGVRSTPSNTAWATTK